VINLFIMIFVYFVRFMISGDVSSMRLLHCKGIFN
jgi:hypothetical protein